MRAVAMADGGLHIDAATGALAGGVTTAFLAWLGQRLVGRAAIQTAVAVTFEKQTAIWKDLVDQLRQELRETSAEREEARSEAASLRAELRQKDAIIAGFERTTIMPHGVDPS